MKIKVAHLSGFCSGVIRAISLAEKVSSKKDVFMLGPLIHNKQVVESLKEKGVRIVERIDDISSGIVIFRSHGVIPEDYIKAREKGLTIVDGTCPIVAKVQQIAKELKDEGYCVVVFGEKMHPEVRGIVGYAKDAIVIKNKMEARKIKEKRIGLISQTTQSLTDFSEIIEELLKNTHCLKVYNTICKTVLSLQKNSISLAKKSELFFIIGGSNSANTKRLFLLTKGINPNTYTIEDAKDIKKRWLFGKEKIGIAAGTSTPPWVIKEVVEKIKKLSCKL